MTQHRSLLNASAALIVLGLLALGGCATDGAEHEAKVAPPILPTERYSIEVSPAPQEMKLAAHASGLSSTQADALGQFVHDWMAATGGEITLKAPEHGPDPAGAYRTVTGARDYLIARGVAPDKVRIVGYDAGGDAHAPILVGYMRYHAQGPDCGKAWSDLSKTYDNEGYPEFGCAVTANIAAQIADPADLLAPRASDAPDAQRRQVVLDKYRQGAQTSTAADPQADGSSSKTAGQ
jgi:pilus assembly protein CpaD